MVLTTVPAASQRLQHLAPVVRMALSSAPGEVVGPAVVSREPSETGSESWSPFARPKGAVKALTRLLRLRPEYQVLSGGEAKWLKHPLADRELREQLPALIAAPSVVEGQGLVPVLLFESGPADW